MLDLFSGIGGFSLGLERAGMETVAFCEIDSYCRKVLKKHWPSIPIHEDIRNLNGEQYRGTVDVVCGGFPCQPYSVAGKQLGEEDDRALWPEMYRIIREVEPAWIIGENVDGFRTMGLDACISDLEDSGYAVQTFDIPACGVGAPHIRHRLWIVANTSSKRRRKITRSSSTNEGEYAGRSEVQDYIACGHGQSRDDSNPAQLQRSEIVGCQQNGTSERGEGGGIHGNANGAGCRQQRRPEPIRTKQSSAERASWRITESPVCGADDVVPRRVDRLRSLGNSVVPAIPELIGRAIMEVA